MRKASQEIGQKDFAPAHIRHPCLDCEDSLAIGSKVEKNTIFS